MRISLLAVFATVVLVGLSSPADSWAERVSVNGSLTVASATGALRNNEVVGTVITRNPGFHKMTFQQFPLPGGMFVAPFFVDQDAANPTEEDLETIVLLINTTDRPVMLTVTFRGAAGTMLKTSTQMLAPNETRQLRVSELLAARP